ncbi:ubiquitin carboxyl-terminal hydrolase 3-like [Oscarella lobularis]|uniref:ubiquitin carboxyl-terminal hydrolase 3-like n=1 Tax=Oscarella lobularis TaxID=121494 RepID=UPI00331334EB
MDCPHVQTAVRINADYLKRTCSDHFTCKVCKSTKSAWICLMCGATHCGRYVRRHAVEHYEENLQHSVCMDKESLAVFCYICDEYAGNDTKTKLIGQLRKCMKEKRNKKRPLNEESNSSATKRAKTIEDDATPCKLVGLRNLGNTCFMNAVLQSLSNIKEFSVFFRRLPAASLTSSRQTTANHHGYFTRSRPRPGTNCSLVEEVRKCIIALRSEGSAPHSPDSLFATVWRVVPRFRGFQQQDAHEFLRYLLDQLHSELQEHVTRKMTSKRTIVSGVFGGMLQNEVTCLECRTQSIKQDPILDLSLDIPRRFQNSKKNETHCCIRDCLSSFVQKEELQESELYYCLNCKCKQRSTKKFWIKSLPQVLCLHLKRFHFTTMFRSKIDTHVQFPISGLDMSPYLLSSSSSEEASSLYDLGAVIVHHGSGVSSGHYTAYACSHVAGNWFHFNDSHVSRVREDSVLSCKAYILFYVKRQTKEVSIETSDDCHIIDVET